MSKRTRSTVVQGTNVAVETAEMVPDYVPPSTSLNPDAAVYPPPLQSQALQDMHWERLGSEVLLRLARQCVADSDGWFGNTVTDRGKLHQVVHHALCLGGEVGEVQNLVKKVDRGSFALEEVYDDLTEEITDVFIYLMNLVGILDFDLQKAYDSKRAKNAARFDRR